MAYNDQVLGTLRDILGELIEVKLLLAKQYRDNLADAYRDHAIRQVKATETIERIKTDAVKWIP